MGLPRAIKAHVDGNIDEAMKHYERAIEQKQYKPELFQNYGSLLKDQGKVKKSEEVYCKGLSLFTDDPGILTNYANLVRFEGRPTEALSLSMRALRRQRCLKAKSLDQAYFNCIDALINLSCLSWALELCRLALTEIGQSKEMLWMLFRLSNSNQSDLFTTQQRDDLMELIENNLIKFTPLEQAEFLFVRSFFELKRGKSSLSLDLMGQARRRLLLDSRKLRNKDREKAQKLIDVNAWNCSCLLLKLQAFEAGWRLFEHGLRTPAPGQQLWQRALFKPFSHRELPLWRGSQLSGQRLLLLEEQAIGDTMMFITLIPPLLAEAKHVGLVVGKRLLPIYQRVFGREIDDGIMSVWSHDAVRSGLLRHDEFDLQCPLGSICQHRFLDIHAYAPRNPILKADVKNVQKLRGRYTQTMQPSRVVGISWRGGGVAARIREKSVNPSQFAALMREFEDTQFVSLQYGDVSNVVRSWKEEGLSIVHDINVNPLKDMNLWLDQVAACDAVISVANTTIHGAGGLNIPTLCLLSVNSDWRWLDDPSVQRSYWYPSVGIARQHENGSWQQAFVQAREWLASGCPFPKGAMHRAMASDLQLHAFLSMEDPTS